jgi:membrane-associated protease RseP (regulator of RpoE activity)
VAAAPADRDRGRGVFVPAWVAVVVGVLFVAGLGFAIGWIAAPGDDSDASNAVATQPGGSSETPATPDDDSRPSPDFPGPNFPGNGNGNRGEGGNRDDDANPIPPLLRGAYFGVTVESVDDDGGARITAVAEDGPAAEAGLQAGDVVTRVDGEDVTSSLDLIRAIRQHEPDDSVTVTYTRNGTSSDAEVTLSERPTTQSVS